MARLTCGCMYKDAHYDDCREAARQDGYRLALADLEARLRVLHMRRDIQDSVGYYKANGVGVAIELLRSRLGKGEG